MSLMNNDYSPISKRLWIPDSQTNACMSCESVFRMFKRRHHCRYCGYIFCNTCIIKKSIRSRQSKPLKKICKKCHNLILKVEGQSVVTSIQKTAETQRETLENRLFTGENPNDSVSSTEEVTKPRIFKVSEDLNKEIQEIQQEMNNEENKWEGFCSEFLINRTRSLVNSLQLNEDLVETISALVECAVKSIFTSVQFRGDVMDITNFIRIQKVIHKDRSYTNFMSGLAFPKNLASKKMNKFLQSPRILIIKKITVTSSRKNNLTSMERLIEQEDSLTSVILKKILEFRPNLIVCKNSLSQSIISDLLDNNISAMINVKTKYLKLIARATAGKVLGSYDEIPYEKNFVGECNSFFVETRGKTNLVHFTGIKERSLIGTIFISGPDAFELTSIKKALKTLIIEYRNSRIERSLFNMFNLESHLNLIENLSSNSIIFKHFILAYNKMCIRPETVSITFYAPKDMALGEFLIRAHEKLEEKCICASSWGIHTLYYLKKDGRIKIRFSKSNIKESSEIYFNRECKICGKFEITTNLISNTLWEYSFYKFLNNFFISYNIISLSLKCKHNFFRLSKFAFFLKGIKVNMEWEENSCFEVLSMNKKPEVHAFHSELLETTIKEVKALCSNLLEELVLLCEDLVVTVNNYSLRDDLKSQILYWEGLTCDLSKVIEAVSSSLMKVYEVSVNSHTNVFQVHATRRSVYLEICRFKIIIANIQNLIAQGLLKEKFSDTLDTMPERTRTRLMSSSEETFDGKHRNFSVSPTRTHEKLHLIDEKIQKSDELMTLRKGNVTLPLGKNNFFVPVEEDDPLSIIAYCLNSNEYYEEVLSTLPDRENVDMIESELLNCSEKHFQYQVSTLSEEDFKDTSKKEDLYGEHITFNVHIFYPRQFQIIRDIVSGNNLNFTLGIQKSLQIKEQLGKSKATFATSCDNLYIIKVLDEKEFTMFKELAPNYFRHFCNAEFHNMPCRMVRTLGCFRIYTKNHTKGKSKCEWALLFENLGAIMPKEVEVYDLKGAFNERRHVPKDVKRTKMDMNFLEDFQGLPITVSKEAKKALDMSIWNDTLFLAKQNIVDYSLLVIISLKYKIITVGIIDYIAQYTLEKAFEHKYKSVVGTDNPTITKPAIYKNRFREAISNRFFIDVED